MKTTIYLITLFTVTACISSKERERWSSETKTTSDKNTIIRDEYLSHQVDTFGRWWYFQTDSTFSYHTDSGITAGSGSLWLWEQGNSIVRQKRKLDQQDVEKESQDQGEKYHRSHADGKSISMYWIAMLVVVGMVMGWRKTGRSRS